MTDCLVIGFNDPDFASQVRMVKSMGAESGAYRDLNLTFINYNGRPYRSMDILNHFYFENKREAEKRFSNVDFLWPVVLYLGTYLHRREFSFDYVNLFHLEKEKLKEKLTANEILTVAITTTLYVTAQPILEIISFIKKHNERVKIIVGGPYIYNQTRMVDLNGLQQQFKYLGADYYVISQEGEAALVNLLSALKQGASLDRVDNIAYRDGENYVVTNSSIESNPLEENMVDYRLFDRADINQFISLRTAKSCPFSCSFCGFPQRAGKYKYTEVDLVENELNTLADLGVSTVTFLDDTFNVPKNRFQEILKMMIRNRYGFKWNSFYRSDHGDEETINLMAKSGCEGVFLGVESGSDRMLERMNKTSRRINYWNAIPLLQAAGISAHANLIVGFPGETYETVQETTSLIEEAKPDFFRAQLWYADPMTPIWKEREKYGVEGASFHWSHNTMDYQTACDLIDKMFLSMENSIWLPQNGFEQWSTFYLQRRGMRMDQIKLFLRCFNAAVKEKLINPHKQEIDPQLVASLKRSCQFDRAEPPEMGSIEIISGANYKAAEDYWVGEFEGCDSDSTSAVLHSGSGKMEEESRPYLIDGKLLAQFGATNAAELTENILAVYGVLLSRLSGRKDVTVVASLDRAGEEIALPLRLPTPWDVSFSEYREAVRSKIDRSLEHGRYGLPILSNPWRMAERGATCPTFGIGFFHTEWRTEGEAQGKPFQEPLRLYPEVKDGIGLALNVWNVGSSGANLGFSYRKRLYAAETTEKMMSYLTSMIEEFCKNPDLVLGDIKLGGDVKTHSRAMNISTSEEFNF